MKIANADWKQIPLTETIINRMADLYFDGQDWLDVLIIDQRFNDELILMKLLEANLVTEKQSANYMAVKEWWQNRRN